MKQLVLLLLFMIALLSFLLNISFFLKLYETHKCKWIHCPYEGIQKVDWKESVIENTDCEEGSDCYEIDILHLKYPKKDYDELEELLFVSKPKPVT